MPKIQTWEHKKDYPGRDESSRSMGIGKKLLDFATTESESRDMNFVVLDARPQAIPFYERNGFVAHTSPSMKKPLR